MQIINNVFTEAFRLIQYNVDPKGNLKYAVCPVLGSNDMKQFFKHVLTSFSSIRSFTNSSQIWTASLLCNSFHVLYQQLLLYCYCYIHILLLLYFGTHTYQFLPEEGLCYIFSTRNNCFEFLASYGVIIQSVNQFFHVTAFLLYWCFLFSLDKGSCYFLLFQDNCWVFMHLMMFDTTFSLRKLQFTF